MEQRVPGIPGPRVAVRAHQVARVCVQRLRAGHEDREQQLLLHGRLGPAAAHAVERPARQRREFRQARDAAGLIPLEHARDVQQQRVLPRADRVVVVVPALDQFFVAAVAPAAADRVFADAVLELQRAAHVEDGVFQLPHLPLLARHLRQLSAVLEQVPRHPADGEDVICRAVVVVEHVVVVRGREHRV